MPAADERLDQLTGAVRDLASRIGTLSADLTGVTARLDALDARLEAAQSSSLRNAERIESVAAEHSEFARLEAATSHLRQELLGAVGRLESDLRDLSSAVERRHSRDVARLSGEVGALSDLKRSIEEVGAGIEALARRTTTQEAHAAKLEARVDEVSGERAGLEERAAVAERHTEVLVDALSSDVDSLRSELVQHRSVMEASSETVREARAVAEDMKAEAARLTGVQHATAEAERVFEDRVLAAIEELRSRIETDWERFLHADEQKWSALAHANGTRDRQLADVLNELQAIQDRIDRTRSELAESQRLHAEAVVALRRDVASAIATLRSALGSAAETVETQLPRDEQTSSASERREAVRQALRSKREPTAG